MNQSELENRLIRFTIGIDQITSQLINTNLAFHLRSQLLRSGLSSALNYGEARGAESKKDFIHKLRLCLKELRETHVALKIIREGELSKVEEQTEMLLSECNQLISIFVKSLKTLTNQE